MSVLIAFSVMIGITISIVSGEVLNGSNSSILLLLASVPLSATLVPSLIEYLNSRIVKRMHCAFVGSSAVNEYSDVDLLSFSDTEALEISSLTEINPTKSSENAHKWSNMAKRIFIMLGGPISECISSSKNNDSNVERDLIINSISENGIDVYFDSSVNVLIGDRFYMLSHNIKVKTDVKLTTAVKGADRSIIYVAFDGVPRVGFIATGKVRASFLDTLGRLHRNGIRTAVRTYEPEINDSYFEANNVSIPLSVIKPSMYECMAVSEAVDSGVVAKSSADMCRAIIYGKKILKDRKKQRRIQIFQTIIGMLAAFTIALIGCFLPHVSPVNLLIAFYCLPAVIMIPNAIHIIKIIKRK
jgi:hypothetical protein